jgi:hypothetical protein
MVRVIRAFNWAGRWFKFAVKCVRMLSDMNGKQNKPIEELVECFWNDCYQ